MNGVTVRAVRDEDDIDAPNAGNRAWYGGALMRDMFSVDDGTPAAMLVAELDGRLVGYAHAVGHGVAAGHRGVGWVNVLPEARRRGVGAALWWAVLEVCTPDRVKGVMVQTDDSDTGTVDVALAHGFRRAGLHQESVLDLDSVEAHRARAVADRAPGVELRQLPDDATEEDWRAFAAVFHRLMRDTPDMADGGEPMPYDVLRAVMKEPWQVMGAWRDGRMVGFTALAVRDDATGALNTWMTGVDRDLRGLGLATALKTKQALAVRDAGWRTIATQNMEGNDAILASNRTLGFVPSVGLRDLTFDY